MNSPLLILLLSVLCGLTAAIRVPVSYDDTPSSCPGPAPSKVVLCYYDGQLSLKKLDPCLCSHLVFTSAATVHPKNYTLNLTTDVGKATRELRKRNPELHVLVSVGGDHVPTEVAEALVKSADRRAVFSSSVARMIKDEELNGVELNFNLDVKGGSKHSKGGVVAFAKLLRKEMGVEKSHRSKRDYSVFEQIDDISTTAWTPFNFKPFGSTRDVRRADLGPRTPHRPILRSARTDTDNYARELLRQSYLELEQRAPKSRLILVNVPTQPEVLVKRFDLKTLSKYVDYFTVPTHNLTDYSESGVTYHPSRLMGLADILNTDSLLDLLTGLGAPHDKLIISIPATATKFTLKDAEQNTPRSPVTSSPETITQTELCALMSAGGWTIERDEDLTAPYAFKNDTWLAFDDRISIGIKSKYVLLRDLAGAALYTVDSADWSGSCLEENGTDIKAPRLLHSLHHAFTSLARKSRGAVLETLQEDIRTSTLLTFSGDVHLSPYRIVRVVDNQGAVHVVRKDARTEFECSRQGYFRHPLGCNRFYRCVKFNQYSSDFTVFEYDCPAGLAFDERWEVCVWPGSLPEGACHGSSEIAPVPKARYACPAVEGYYADPENCRWFFACLDHARDGVTPLTAYEFRCPFGLVFDEQNLLCQWPWLVDGCGNSGVYVGAYFGAVGFGSAASRGYVATAGSGGYAAGGAAVGGAVLGAGVRLGSGAVASGGYAAGYSAGKDAGTVLVQDVNSGENIVTGTGYSAGAGRGSFRYSSSAAEEGAFGAHLANSYAAGGRGGQRFSSAGSYNEGRHLSSYASFPDSLVSGGRIESSGGVVLEQNVGIHGIGSEFGSRAGEATLVTAGVGAGISTGRGSSFSSGISRGQENHFSAGVVSSVPVQAALPVATYEKTAYGNAGSVVSSVPIKTAVPAAQVVSSVPVQTAVPLATYEKTVHGNAGDYFSGGVVSSVPTAGVVSSVPVQTAVPLATYEKTVHGNAGGYLSGGVVSGVPAAGIVSSVPVQTAVPVQTHQKTVYGNTGGYFSGGVVSGVPAAGIVSSVPVQTAVPIGTHQKTVYSNTGGQFTGSVVSSAPAAVPVATYQKTAYGNEGGHFAGSVVSSIPVQPAVPATGFISSVPVQTAAPIGAYEKTAYGNAGRFTDSLVSSVPVQSAVPVTSFEQRIVETPKVAVAQAPVHQSVVTSVDTPRASFVPVTTFRKPLVEPVPVTPVVPIAPVAPVVSQPVIPQVSVVNSAPVTTFVQKSPVLPATSRRTKLRPVVSQVSSVPIFNTVSTTAVPVNPIQSEFVGGGYSLRGRPAVSVVNGGAAGISVPVSQSNVKTVFTGVAAPVTPVPVFNSGVTSAGYTHSTAIPAVPISTGYSSGGFVSSTPAPAVVTNGYVSSPAPFVTDRAIPVSTGYSSGSFISSGPALVTPNAPVVKSGGNAYSTPVTAVFPGVSVTPAPIPKLRISPGRVSYSTPAPAVYTATPASAIVTGEAVSVTPVPILPAGGNVPILRAGLAPAEGYSYPKPSRPFITGKDASFSGVSLSNGLEPALHSNAPGLAVGLEIPSPTVGPAVISSGNVGASRLRIVPTSNIELGNVQENGYISSTVAPVVSLNNQGYSREQGAVYSSTVAPVQPLAINTGFGVRNSHRGVGFISAFPGAVPAFNGLNATSRAYLPPTTAFPTGAPLPSYTVRTRGRARPYGGRVSGFVTSTPIPEVYSSTPRPTTFQAPIVSSTIRPVTYRGSVVTKPAPVVTEGYLSPQSPIVSVTPIAPIEQSTYQSRDGYGARVNGPEVRIRPSSKTQINYDNENVEALLNKYSGNFGGLLDNNKEGFVSGVINEDLAGRSRGRISQGGRGHVDTAGLSGVRGGYTTTASYSDGGSSTAFGTRTSYSTTSGADIVPTTLGSRGGYSTTVSPGTLAENGLRGKVRFGANTNIDADGGIGYEAVTVGYEGIKSKSKENPVVVITRLSDINPLLIAKLGAQCTCKSNTLTLKRPEGYSRGRPSTPISNDDLLDAFSPRSGTYEAPEHIPSAPLPGSNIVTGTSPDLSLNLGDGIVSTSAAPVTLAPVPISTPKSAGFLKAVGLDDFGVTPSPTILVTSARPRGRPYSTAQPVLDLSSPTPFAPSVRSRVRPQVPEIPVVPVVTSAGRSRPVLVSSTPVPVAVTSAPEIVPAVRVAVPSVPVAIPAVGTVRADPRVGAGIRGDGGASGSARAGIGAGRAFDRYGPGGWRGADETLQGSVDCQRPGLFRHPKYCNKFYACHWDEWKGRFTLHVFNCPVHLAYDSSLGACNWPSKGPACADDNLLV